MPRVLSVFASVAVATAAGVLASPKKGHKQQSMASKILGGVVRATGLAAAVGGVPTAAASDVHPLYHQTQSDLSSLLAHPCQAAAVDGQARCPMESRFQQWAMDLNKAYVTRAIVEGANGDQDVIVGPTAGQEAEYESRFRKFAGNVALAKDFNEESKGEATFGITKFSDMDEQEFMSQRGGMVVDDAQLAAVKKLPKAKISRRSAEFLADAPQAESSKDWSADGYTTAVKDQGQCGSCWAFSTTEQVESMAIKQGILDESGEPYVLGPQELVSCDHDGDEGCNGGLPSNALEWLEGKALERESDYPYISGITGASGSCKLKKSKGVMEVVDVSQVSSGAEEEDDLKDYVLTEGPASVGVDANAKWQLYTGGVLHADDCMGQLDHAVQVVGVDTEEGTWKVRNSWNSDWGEDGYIRLKLGTNTCGVANMAVTATVKKVSDTSKPADILF